MRADRLLAITLLLQTRGKMTAQALAHELEVSRRTILRDIDALSVIGVPIYAMGGHGGGFALDESYQTPLTGLHEKEILTLLVTGNTQLFGEIGLGDAAKSTLLKLLAALPSSHQSAVEHMRQRVLIDPIWWWRDIQQLPFWEQLQQAVHGDQLIRVVYETYKGQIKERVLEPYSLVAKSSTWYLVARHHGELHTYHVARFHQIELLDARFQRQAGFDLPTYWRDHLQKFAEILSDYHFMLRVHPDRESFIRRLVPGRYHIVDRSDVDGWLTIHFYLDSLDLAKMLVFGLGKQAVIVEPAALQDIVLDAAHELLENDAPTNTDKRT